MIVYKSRGLGGMFGATGATGNNCPVPAGNYGLIFNHNSDSLAWCDCMFPSAQHPTWNANCKKGGFSATNPGLGAAPWTTVGRNARGLPDDSVLGKALQTASAEARKVTGSSPAGSPPPSAPAGGSGGGGGSAPGGDDTIFGVPKKVAMIGGGILAAGVFAATLKRKR